MKNQQLQFPQYPYFSETRSPSQIELAVRLTRSLTERNLYRNSKHVPKLSTNKIKKEDFLYVYIYGIPILKQQYAGLKLPGETIYHRILAFDMSDEELNHGNYFLSFREEAGRLKQKIEKEAKGKLVVLVSHSFGDFVLATYLHHHMNDKIVGLVSIGGIPVRAHPRLRLSMKLLHDVGPQGLHDSRDALTTEFKKSTPNVNLYEVYYTPERVEAFFMLIHKQEPMLHLFEYMRNWPKLLKCIICGRKDNIMPEHLTSQKMTHYSYNQQFSQEYQQRLDHSWKKMHGTTCDNIQEQFVYNIDGGYHSLHIQNKLKGTIANIIDEYLTLIETTLNNDSKL